MRFSSGQHSPHNTVIEVKFPNAVNRNIAVLSKMFKVIFVREYSTEFVLAKDKGKDNRIIRKRSDLLLQQVHCEVFEVDEPGPIFVMFENLFSAGLQRPLAVRVKASQWPLMASAERQGRIDDGGKLPCI